MRSFSVIVLAFASTAFAQPTNVTLVRATAQQLIIAYDAPSANACRLEASEQSGFVPPVADLDPALYEGADYDLRRSSTHVQGARRTVVLGKRRVDKALDGKRHSRSLQANTMHYVRITCDGKAASLQAGTQNIPLGAWTDAFQPITDTAILEGYPAQPYLDWGSRDASTIDHLTGTLIKRLNLPPDGTTSSEISASACTGTNWSNPGNCTANDGNVTTYAAGARDVLFAPISTLSRDHTVPRLQVIIYGSISGSPQGDDRYVDVCLTRDGSNCIGAWKPVDLTGPSPFILGNGDDNDQYFWSHYTDIPATLNWRLNTGMPGVLIKPRTTSTSYSISIDQVKFQVMRNYVMDQVTSTRYTNYVPITDNGDGHTYFLAVVRDINGQYFWYSIDTTAGRAYHLGGPNFGPRWSRTNGRVFWTLEANQIKKYTIANTPGALSTDWVGGGLNPIFSSQNFTPAPYTLKELLAAFDSRYDTEWQTLGTINLHDPNIGLGADHDYLSGWVWTGQDRAGWMFVFDTEAPPPPGSTGSGNIVAMYFTAEDGLLKYCNMHADSLLDFDHEWIGFSCTRPSPTATGFYAGPWAIKVEAVGGGDIPPQETTFQLLPQNGSYHAVDPSPSAYIGDREIPIAVGDWFRYCPNNPTYIDSVYCSPDEILEITAIDEVNHRITVFRGGSLNNGGTYAGSQFTTTAPSTTPATIAAGSLLYAVAKSRTTLQWTGIYWNWKRDPHANTVVNPPIDTIYNTTYPPAPGTYSAASGYRTPQFLFPWPGGHGGYGNGYSVANYSAKPPCKIAGSCYGVIRTRKIEDMVNQPEQVIQITGYFGGKTTSAYGLESHTNAPHESSAGRESLTRYDILPKRGAAPGTAVLQSGTTQVYQITGVTLNRKHFDTLAQCGFRTLRDLSGPSTGNVITDSTPYSYCVANAANECRTGAAAGDIFVSCPLTQTTNRSSPPSGITYYDTATVSPLIADQNPIAHGIQQFWIGRDAIQNESRRTLVRLWMFPDADNIYAQSYAVGDNKWVLYRDRRVERGDWYMAKVPSWPEQSSIPANTWERVKVEVGSVPNGADNVVVQFGYEEYGNPEDYYCTTRREACAAASQSFTETDPFQFSTSSTAGVPCAGGCQLEIPRVPGRILFARIVFRNAGGSVLAARRLPAL